MTAAALSLDWRDPIDAFAPLAEVPYSLLLLSDGSECARTSWIFADPVARVCGDGEAALSALRGRRGSWLAGLWTYELGAETVGAPPAGPRAWPDVAVGVYAAAAVFDHSRRAVRVVGDRAAALAARLGDAASPPPPPAPPRAAHAARRRADVEVAIARAIGYVRAGDIYQANVSQRFDVADAGPPFAAFRRLVAASPAPFAAYFALDGDRVLATHSPESFLSFAADGAVESRPIKGTRPRGASPGEDARLAAALVASEKDKAENLMIVDLMRNDLSRVAAPRSVSVPELNALESYANVHHLVSTVRARLADGATPLDAAAAAFPPGSVTGAPKRRAMEIIAELEGEARGPYCGALGHLDPDGAGDFNVLIRTIAFERAGGAWRAQVRSGGGITAGSDPAEEYDETLHKAGSIFAALGVARVEEPGP